MKSPFLNFESDEFVDWSSKVLSKLKVPTDDSQVGRKVI